MIDLSLAEVNAIEFFDETSIKLKFDFPVETIKEDLIKIIITELANPNLTVEIQQDIISHAVQLGLHGLPNVKNIIAIASGKGGVGKSTITANLALALTQAGANVGILDADIYGPNQAHMLGIVGHPEISDNKKILPMHAHGLQVMSMAFLTEQSDIPMIWRGPMVSSALQQLLLDTLWQQLDYLFIDLPPGTGDIQLTMSQKIPVSGGIIVSTPQDIALLDAKKAIRMFEKVNISVLGVVENMSSHICSECGHKEAIFNTDGAKTMAEEYKVPFLGALPLDIQIRTDADAGRPSVIANPNSKIAVYYQEIALKAAAYLSQTGKDKMRKFPKIVIET